MTINNNINSKLKLVAVFTSGVFISVTCSACGIALGDSMIMGTTGYLREHNQRDKPMGSYTQAEKQDLDAVINRRY